MKPENKLPVLDLISAEMKTVVNTLQPDLPPWPATGAIAEQRQYYTLERRFWNADAPEMATRAYRVPTKYGQVKTRIFYPQPDSPATLFWRFYSRQSRYPRSHHAPAGKLQPMYGDWH